MRRLLYLLARLFGDWKAVRHGTVHKRLYNRAVGRMTGRRLWWK